jgi:prepilin-type N-terminal cleavage/methylation domain-containing protein
MSMGHLRRRGFTLLEMSIVLIIIGVVIGGGMTIFSASLQKRQWQETQAKLKAIQKALLDFRIINNRLPCPADVTLALTDTNFGVEGVLPGACTTGSTYVNDVRTVAASPGPTADFVNILTPTGTTNFSISMNPLIAIVSMSSTTGIVAGMGISGTGIPSGDSVASVVNGTSITVTIRPTGGNPGETLTIGNNVEGMVPTNTLRLPDDYAIDGWGRRIMYTVDVRFTAPGALAPYPSGLTMTANTHSIATVDSFASTSGLSPKMFVYGKGIQTADTIASITSATAITLTTTADATIASNSLTFSTTPTPIWNPVILATDNIQRMTVNDASGHAKTTTAAYVLVSFGPNGHGAFPRNGAALNARISSGSNHADELANCDCTNGGVSNAIIPAGTFVQEQPDQTAAHLTDPTYFFDDIVAYGTRSDLRSPAE